jgi:WXG100 family type VII secretion target
MARFQVDSEAVLGSSQQVHARIASIQAEVTALTGQLTSLQGSWTGTAATAFQSVVVDWHATQRRVEESLAAINQALALAAQHYQEIERANTRLFLR